ncbi:MAG: hypothetical protein HN696_06415 [Euryarchaeota archaeon]|nr:hypothetical protein [Euryarchaeota archaeon]
MSMRISHHSGPRVVLGLVFIMLFSVFTPLTPPAVEELSQSLDEYRHGSGDSMVSYDLYIAEQNSSAGGSGVITTHIPDSGGQQDETMVGGGVEFKSVPLISNLTVIGDEGGGSEVPLRVYIRFSGQEGSTADLTFELMSGTTVVATASGDLDDPCQDGIIGGSSCAYQYRPYTLDISSTLPDGGGNGFVVLSGKQITLRMTAETNCGSGGGVPGQGSSDCDVRVAYGNVDNSNGAYTSLSVKANALANSKVKVHSSGGSWNDAEVLEWAPNHRSEYRAMQFSVDVRDSFGRDDIKDVKLVMNTPDDTAVVFEKTFSNSELKLDNEGLVAQHEWTYSAGRAPGEYGLRLEVRDMQDNLVVYSHDGVEFVEYAVFLQLTPSQGDVILIAPEKTSTVEFELEHIGADGVDLDVQLSLQRNPGSDWLVEFSEPGGYELSGGGALVRPTLTVTAPDDLSDAPSQFDIIGRAYADTNNDGTSEEVQVVTTSVSIEEVGVFAPPKMSVFEDEEHTMEIADSERPDAYDSDVSHFIDGEGAGQFYMEVLNSGFDFDTFRIRVDGPHTWTVRMYDQDTSSSLVEEGAYFMTNQVESHNFQSMIVELTPPLERGVDDIAKFAVSVLSEGNNSLRSNLSFTAHRTYGVFAQVTSDEFGLPLGHIGPFSSARSQPLVITIDITNAMDEGESVSNWQIINPSELDVNLEYENQVFGTWEFAVSSTDSSAVVNTISLGPGDVESIRLSTTPGNKVKAGNHTIYLRILEIGEEELPRYFDLPLEFEIESDMPDDLEIIQISTNLPMQPGDKRTMDFKVFNGNNVDLDLLLEIDGPDGWEVDLDSIAYMGVDAFGEKTFSVVVIAPKGSVRDGDIGLITITAQPLHKETAYGPSYTKTKKVEVNIECSGSGDCLLQELISPRQSTVVAGGGFILLIIFAAFLRGKRSGKIYEDFVEEVEFEEDSEIDFVETEEIADEEWEEDIELLD